MHNQHHNGTDKQRREYEKPKEYVTAAQLKKIAPTVSATAIETFLPYINRFLPQYDVTTPRRIAAFLAQVLHESGGLKYVRELWGPTTQQKKYERDFNQPWNNKLKKTDRNVLAYMLGNSEPGDGARFKGHGLIQVTGRANHLQCSKDLFNDARLIENPKLLTVPEYAVLSAFWFWKKRKLNPTADFGDVKAVTKIVNGGKNGLDERIAYFDKAIVILS